jgi:two-component system, NarL family, invasion response regulator UvrY
MLGGTMNVSPQKAKELEVKIRVLLVDDHDVVRAGVKMMLSRYKDISIIGEVSSGLRALDMVREYNPDIILMDIKMPGDIGGLGATVKLTSSHPGIKIIVLSGCEDDPFPAQLIAAGAAGYLHKRCGAPELAQAIRQVHKGIPYVTSSVVPQLVPNRKFINRGAELSPFTRLSTREMTVATMISNGQSIQEVAHKLCISSKTVNTYRYRSFEKLAVKNDIELTHLAIKYKIVDRELPDIPLEAL